MLFDTATGEVRPAGCLRVRCPSCVPYLAWRRGLAIAHVEPERFVTLTRVGDSWPVVRDRMKRLRYALARETGGWQWCWSVEVNPRGTGHHVHAWQRGRFVAQSTLSRLAAREGMGPVADIRRVRGQSREAAGYALKALTYGVKGAADDQVRDDFLAINGHRLTHQSRGWWPEGGCRPQERAAVLALRGGEPSSWRLVDRRTLHRTAMLTAAGLALASAGPPPG